MSTDVLPVPAARDNKMSTKEVVEDYLDAIRDRRDWESLLAEDAAFTSFTSPVRETAGKAGYIAATKAFYSKVESFELRQLLIDGDRACALTRYQVRGQNGEFSSDVAELFTVKDGRVTSLGIYFDTAPYSR